MDLCFSHLLFLPTLRFIFWISACATTLLVSVVNKTKGLSMPSSKITYFTHFYNRGQFSLRNLNAAHQKQLFPILPLEFLQVTSRSPLPLYNVYLGSADCRETVRDPPNNIGLGGGGAGIIWSFDCLLVKTLGRVRFLNF